MLDVRRAVVRRWIALVTVTVLLAVPVAAGASPSLPVQEDPSRGEDEAATDRAQIDVDETMADDDPSAVIDAINQGTDDVATELENLTTAQAAVDDAVGKLADADSAISETTFAIEELREQSDAVVIDAFMNPPAENAWDVFAAESISDATIKQGVLDLRADESAGVLDKLAEQQAALEIQREEERGLRETYAEAKGAADAALADLQTTSDQQTEFVLAVQRRLDEGIPADLSPEEQRQAEARRAEIQGAIDAVQEEARRQAQLVAAELERQRIEEENRRLNRIWCPVDGTVNFTDTWGAARSGGRTHKGTDMMADYGTPTVAPVSGRVEHRSTSLGGLSWYVYGDNGHKYYGTHLQSYAQQGVGHVDAGSVIGYVGASGNAPDDAPHLHFEWMPNGGESVNPYSILDEACPNH